MEGMLETYMCYPISGGLDLSADVNADILANDPFCLCKCYTKGHVIYIVIA